MDKINIYSHKDYLGNIINTGDEVIYITLGYREFSKGIVIGFSECFVYVDKIPILFKGKLNQIKQQPQQLIKI